MRSTYFLLAVFLFWTPALAHQPVVLETSSEPITITDPNTSFAYYGQLNGSAQRFTLTADERFTLFVQLLEPDIKGAKKNLSASIFYTQNGSETRVADLAARNADWEQEFEFFGGDYYLAGPELWIQNATSGTYIIEVTSPNNEGKYVLVTGTEENFSNTNPVVLLAEIYAVKQFFEKSPLAIVQTPFVYLPLGLLTLVLMVVVYWRLVRKPDVDQSDIE